MKKLFFLLVPLSFLFYNNSLHSQNFWQQTNGPYGAFALSLACDSLGQIYVGTMTQGLYKSDNIDHIWTRIGLNGKIVNSILIFSNHIIFAATDGGLYQSFNGGNT